jgi:hypothetical protein
MRHPIADCRLRIAECRLATAVLLALAVLVLVVPVYAGDYGRIRGRVLDSETRGVVAGAAVEVDGTDYGATTEEDGTYEIPNVPGGVHSLTVSAMGYEPKRFSNVLVIVDQTISVNFDIQSTAILITRPVEAIAKATIVKTQTTTQRALTNTEFDKIPVASLAEIVGLQAGVVSEPSRGMHLRGGRPDEIAYYVDGASTTDPIYGYQAARINPEATAEVIVISGGFDAEYGEAMSGIVQVITKEGKEKTAGRFKYTTDQFMPAGAGFGYNQFEGSIGGALKLGKQRLGMFFSPELRLIGDYNPRKYRLPHQSRNDYKLTGKLNYSTGGVKLTWSGFLSREQYGLQTLTPDDENHLGFRYNMDHYLSDRSRVRKTDLALDQMISKDLFYSVRAGYFYDGRTRAVRDLEREAVERDFGKRFWEDYIFRAEDSVLARDSVIYDLRRFYDRQRNDVTLNPYGVNRLFYGVGDYRTFLAHWSSVGSLKGDVTYNLQKTHEFKVGFEARLNELARRYNSLPSDPNPFVDLYDVRPITGSAYVQDRMDFEDLVIRAGLRLDYLDPNAYYLKNYTDLQNDSVVRASTKFKVSPRLGVSFPVSDLTKFRFSYGHFFQTPAFRYLFETVNTHITRGNMIIGNPDLRAQQTVAYELGLETELSRLFAMDFTAYYKDIYDLIGTRFAPGVPTGYYPLTNDEYGNVRGFEITFNKVLDNYWSSRLSYSLSMARGTASYFSEWYSERYRYGIDPVTGREMDPPKRDYFLDFDERHAVRADVSLQFPRDFSVGVLRDVQWTMLFSFGSGLPYSVRELKQGLNSGRVIGEKFSARMPPRYSVDTRVVKGVHIGPVALNLVLDITNLFDFRNVEWVYGFTGRPDDDGYAAIFSPADWAGNVPITSTSSTYNPARDLDHNGFITPEEEYNAYKTAYKDFVNNPNNYGPPRQIRLGITVEF